MEAEVSQKIWYILTGCHNPHYNGVVV
jgi:hypothetical protein